MVADAVAALDPARLGHGVISFARGVPAPECLAVEELADCARAALERDGANDPLVRPRRRLRAAARVDRRAARRRAGARRHHERLAAGLRLPRRAARPAGRARARRGADVRPAAEDPRAARRRGRRPCRWTTRACIRTRSSRRSGRREARLPLHDPDLPEPERPDAVGGAPPPARRARARARTARARGRPVRARPLRGRRAADAVRARGRRDVVYASSFSKTVAPGVRVGYFVLPAELAARSRRSRYRRTSRRRSSTQATVHEFVRRGNFEPNLERVNGLLASAATRCSRRSSGTCPTGATGAGPKAATSCGSTCRGADAASCSRRRRRRASRS